MAAYIPQPLRDRVRRRARQQCEYCHSIEWLTGQRFEFDHILPLQSGGATSAENLCLACASCNSHKQARVEGLDPESGENFPLFNPRRQRWSEHFVWNEDASYILGITPNGRATVGALQMNHPTVVMARLFWISTGQHPPQDDR